MLICCYVLSLTMIVGNEGFLLVGTELDHIVNSKIDYYNQDCTKTILTNKST